MRCRVTEPTCRPFSPSEEPHWRRAETDDIVEWGYPVDKNHPLPKSLEAIDEGWEPDRPEDDLRPNSRDELKMKVLEALGKLDPEEDNHWTRQGLAAIHAVMDAAGFEVSRDDIKTLAPSFHRSNMVP